MLNNFVENISIQSLTSEELGEVKENKNETIYINNLSYCIIFSQNTEKGFHMLKKLINTL